MGTTLHSMREIADFLECPDELPAGDEHGGGLAGRGAGAARPPAAGGLDPRRALPASDAGDIDARFAERERRGRERYLALGPEMAQLWQEHGITSLAQYYTSKIKYDPDRFALDSGQLRALLAERGFLP